MSMMFWHSVGKKYLKCVFHAGFSANVNSVVYLIDKH